MELEMPQDVLCPLCRDERTELRENKSGRPYFQCATFDSVVNLRPGNRDRAYSLLDRLSEADPEGSEMLAMDADDIQALRNATDEAKLVRWADAPTGTDIMAVWHGGPINIYSVWSEGVRAIESLQGNYDNRRDAEDRMESWFKEAANELMEPEEPDEETNSPESETEMRLSDLLDNDGDN